MTFIGNSSSQLGLPKIGSMCYACNLLSHWVKPVPGTHFEYWIMYCCCHWYFYKFIIKRIPYMVTCQIYIVLWKYNFFKQSMSLKHLSNYFRLITLPGTQLHIPMLCKYIQLPNVVNLRDRIRKVHLVRWTNKIIVK